jgi:hypothetical protein
LRSEGKLYKRREENYGRRKERQRERNKAGAASPAAPGFAAFKKRSQFGKEGTKAV